MLFFITSYVSDLLLLQNFKGLLASHMTTWGPTFKREENLFAHVFHHWARHRPWHQNGKNTARILGTCILAFVKLHIFALACQSDIRFLSAGGDSVLTSIYSLMRMKTNSWCNYHQVYVVCKSCNFLGPLFCHQIFLLSLFSSFPISQCQPSETNSSESKESSCT